MKGIVMAGGTGSRLRPLTNAISKQLLPIYDKPMIYYPLSVLMLSDIRDIMVISTHDDLSQYQRLLGSGEQFGINITYGTQYEPKGIAEAFVIGEEFIGGESVCLVLGDNVFHGSGFTDALRRSSQLETGARIFTQAVVDPSEFGVAVLGENNEVLSLEEKPKAPSSNQAVTGLYFYDNSVVKIAKSIAPSWRNELEITDVNKVYLENGQLTAEILGRGVVWLDTGSHEALIEAGQFIKAVESKYRMKVACLEEIGLRNKWLSKALLEQNKNYLDNTSYGEYLRSL
jgi:glucose-1-phosphate thymidylyltransferase